MKNSLKSIKNGSIGKRMLSWVMDAICAAFTWGALAFLVMLPIVNKGFDYTNVKHEGQQYLSFSQLSVIYQGDKLININETNKMEANKAVKVIPLYEIKDQDVDFYKQRVKYYYLNFKTNTNISYPEVEIDAKEKEHYYSPNFDKEMDIDNIGKVLPRDYYTETWFESNFKDYETVKDWKNAAVKATEDLYNESYFKKINKIVLKSELWMEIPTAVIAFFLFYILPPLLFENGETLGKKVLHLGFATKDGFKIKKRQILFRQLILFFVFMISMFYFSFDLATSLAITGVIFFIYVLWTVFAKEHRSPADLAAYSTLIDTALSVWFIDESEEASKEALIEENLSKLNKKKELDKHVIQVGSTIVNEEIKEEISKRN